MYVDYFWQVVMLQSMIVDQCCILLNDIQLLCLIRIYHCRLHVRNILGSIAEIALQHGIVHHTVHVKE